MAGQNKVDVEILGEHYKLKGDASPEHMMRLARYVDQTMRKVLQRNPRLSIHKAAVLSAVNIADELLRVYDRESAAAAEQEEEDHAHHEEDGEQEDKNENENKNGKKQGNKKKHKK